MNDDDRVLATMIRRLGADDPAPAPPVRQVLRRGRRLRAVRIATTAGGTVAVVAVALVIAVIGRGVDRSPGPGSTGRDSPRLRLAMAAQSTTTSTFRFRITTDQPASAERSVAEGRAERSVVEGSADLPGAAWEAVAQPAGAGRLEQRRIGDRCFDRANDGLRWRSHAGPCKAFDALDLAIGRSANSADPDALLSRLGTVGSITDDGLDGSGPSATHAYSFSYSAAYHADAMSTAPLGRFSGTVKISIGSGQIAEIKYVRALDAGAKGRGDTVRIEFLDHGKPTAITAPSDIEGS